jgi:hypothetical protein
MSTIPNELKSKLNKLNFTEVDGKPVKEEGSIEADHDIKMDGEFHQFEGGGIRYTKTGKGRFDLIPWDVIMNIVYLTADSMDDMDTVYTFPNLLMSLAEQDVVDVIRYITAIKYGENHYTSGAVAMMLRDLAKHYEKGADKYGVDNWKKGIPSDSFWDSGCRHTMQYICGETDEPHYISAIWNMIGYLWVEDNYGVSAVEENSNE